MNSWEATTNEYVLKSLLEGDLVEFPRDKFSHWGVYVGKYGWHKTYTVFQFLFMLLDTGMRIPPLHIV